MDLLNDDGELDRTKVARQIRTLVCGYTLSRSALIGQLTDLVNEALDITYAEGYSDCQDVA